ncbi:hypothetical protein CDAR_426191 [Caerostris darwini]|uniref:Uncharacterized protein n=1 Tax=Caerostris darwini TaxID=1538125 RepID=A0AAV4VWY2_9ARAC|nr:hypothetical protein CDAR_426191 [Caerostris darwini]
MDLLRCEMCNSTLTNFVNHRFFNNEYSYQVIGFENPDYIFGNNPQGISATISHSSAFMNRTSTIQSSTFPQSTEQERHWEVNSTAGTNVRYASSNAIQNENFDYFNSSQGFFFPSSQTFENSDCISGAKNPSMAFSTAASTSTLNPVEQPNNFVLMQHTPNISFYNQHHKYTMQDSEISRFQEKEYVTMAIARKSDRREENTNFASDLNCTSINAKYHRNPHIENDCNHTPALQHASTRCNTVMKE